MKKINLIFIVLCSVVIFSCKKDKKEPIPTGGKLRALSFTLPGFSQSKGPIDAANSGLKTNAVTPPDSVPQLVYRIYDSNGTVLKTVIHLSDDPNYSHFTDSVPAGTYTVVFAAGYDKFQLAGNKLSLDYFWYYDHNDPDYISNQGAQLWSDVFYKKLTLTVGTQDITQNVELQRPLAQVVLNVEDAIPANVKTLRLNFTETNLRYSIAQDKFIIVEGQHIGFDVTLPNNHSLKNLVTGSINNKISALTANIGTPFAITITCYDAAANIVLQKKINISCEPNKVTLVSGKLFSTSGTNSIKVTTNTTWNPDKTPIHF